MTRLTIWDIDEADHERIEFLCTHVYCYSEIKDFALNLTYTLPIVLRQVVPAFKSRDYLMKIHDALIEILVQCKTDEQICELLMQLSKGKVCGRELSGGNGFYYLFNAPYLMLSRSEDRMSFAQNNILENLVAFITTLIAKCNTREQIELLVVGLRGVRMQNGTDFLNGFSVLMRLLYAADKATNHQVFVLIIDLVVLLVKKCRILEDHESLFMDLPSGNEKLVKDGVAFNPRKICDLSGDRCLLMLALTLGAHQAKLFNESANWLLSPDDKLAFLNRVIKFVYEMMDRDQMLEWVKYASLNDPEMIEAFGFPVSELIRGVLAIARDILVRQTEEASAMPTATEALGPGLFQSSLTSDALKPVSNWMEALDEPQKPAPSPWVLN